MDSRDLRNFLECLLYIKNHSKENLLNELGDIFEEVDDAFANNFFEIWENVCNAALRISANIDELREKEQSLLTYIKISNISFEIFCDTIDFRVLSINIAYILSQFNALIAMLSETCGKFCTVLMIDILFYFRICLSCR